MAVAGLETFSIWSDWNGENRLGTLRYMAEALPAYSQPRHRCHALGGLSVVIDNVPLVAASMGMYDGNVSYGRGTLAFYCLLCRNRRQHANYRFCRRCCRHGHGKIDFIWYLRKIAWLAFAGFIAGAGVFCFWTGIISSRLTISSTSPVNQITITYYAKLLFTRRCRCCIAGIGPEVTEKNTSIMDLIMSGGLSGQIIIAVLFVLLFVAVLYLFWKAFFAIKAATKMDNNFLWIKYGSMFLEEISKPSQKYAQQNHPHPAFTEKEFPNWSPLDDINTAIEMREGLRFQTWEKRHIKTIAAQRPW